MRHLPTFFDLAGRRVLVIGTSAAAAQRAVLAASAGAEVVRLGGDIPIDFSKCTLAFVATGDAASDARHAAQARDAGVPVNVVDRPQLCDFIVPAIIDRDDIVVGISTAGASPSLARHVRGLIEAVLPARLGALARFAGDFRGAVRAVIADPRERRRFWDRIIRGPIAARVLAGNERAAREAMIAAVNRRGPPFTGSISLVGAGPGSADLLTLRALQALQTADVVLHDALASPEVLDYARREAVLIDVGKRRGHHTLGQDEINALMVEQARAGRRVVRLKGGDPLVFGRGGEERDYALRHGIEVDIVPGVTAALACAAASGIPLTHRHHAAAVTFLTGHRQPGAPAPDWRALAAGGQTIVIYMGVTVAAELRRELLDAGLARTTPVAIVENGTLDDQKVSRGTLHTLSVLAARHRDGGPALIIVGAVAALADTVVVDLPLARAS